MPACGSSRIKIGELDKDLAIKKARMDAFFDAIEEPGVHGDMRRLALGLFTSESTDTAQGLSKATEYFIWNIIGRKPPKNEFILDRTEISRLEAALHMASDDARRALGIGAKYMAKYKTIEEVNAHRAQLKGLEKFWDARLLPLTMQFAHSRHLPGGQQLFDNLVGLESEHKAKIKTASVEVEGLVKTVQTLTGETFKAGMKSLASVDSEIRRLAQQRIMVEEAYNKGDIKDRKRLDEIDDLLADAGVRRKKMIVSEKNQNTAALINRAMIEIAETENNPHGEGVRRAIATKYFRDHSANQDLLMSSYGPMRSLLDRYKETGDQSMRYLRRLIDVELDRVGSTDEQKRDAIGLIKKTMGVIDEGYFPSQSILNATPVEKVSMLKNMIDSLQSSHTTSPQQAVKLITQISEHMQARGGTVPMENRDINIASLLRHYTESMEHTNYVIRTQHAFGEYLSGIHKIAKMSGSDDAFAFTMAADRMLDFARKRLVGTQSHGAMHELSNLVLTSSVMMKLGIARPAGRLRNIVEGTSMIATKIGHWNMGRIDKRIEANEDGLGEDLEAIMVKHKIKLGGEDRWGEESLGTLLTPKIEALIGDPALVEHYLSVERVRQETATHWFKKLNRGVAKLSNASLNVPKIGWSEAENKLRKSAFKYGAVMAMERSDRTYKTLFNDLGAPIPKSMIEKYDLNGEVLDGRPENSELRMDEYRKLKQTEGLRGGLSLLYRSQGQYSILARHPIEDFSAFGLHIGKLGHLFRQYPDSWNTQFAMGIRDIYYGAQAGGIYEGLIRQPSQYGKKGPDGKVIPGTATGLNPWNSEMPPIYAMAAMLAQIGMGAWLQDEGKDRKGFLGTGFRMVGLFRGDIPTTYGFIRDMTSDDPKKRQWANYGRSAASMFTGPVAGDMEWWLNFGVLAHANLNGHTPLGVHTTAQILGYNPDPETLRVKRPLETLGDVGKTSWEHWINGFSAINDVAYLRNEYNKDAENKGDRMIMAALKKTTGIQKVYENEGVTNQQNPYLVEGR